ncbi:hypothetical protein F4861DRAFT_544350, partial [Xylaria intraflava]
MDITEGFPNEAFFSGGSINISPEENAMLLSQTEPFKWQKGMHVNRSDLTSIPRELLTKNRLGVDETKFGEGSHHQEKYWVDVVSHIAVRPGFKRDSVMRYITGTHTKEKPSNTRLWRVARHWLAEVTKVGNEGKWRPTCKFPRGPNEIRDDAFWEALRIIGDFGFGYGTFPRNILDKMKKAGATWLAVTPKDRHVPACWKRWADDAGMKYAESYANTHKAPRKRKRQPADNNSGLASTSTLPTQPTTSNTQVQPPNTADMAYLDQHTHRPAAKAQGLSHTGASNTVSSTAWASIFGPYNSAGAPDIAKPPTKSDAPGPEATTQPSNDVAQTGTSDTAFQVTTIDDDDDIDMTEGAIDSATLDDIIYADTSGTFQSMALDDGINRPEGAIQSTAQDDVIYTGTSRIALQLTAPNDEYTDLPNVE